MTNPTTHRWIPAAEKPGGLVKGDRVQLSKRALPLWNESAIGRMATVIETGKLGDDVPLVGIYMEATADSDPWFDDADVADLLVRIDEPAPVPESTDAYRQALIDMADVLDVNDPCNANFWEELDRLCREKCIRRIPTPTEAADGE